MKMAHSSTTASEHDIEKEIEAGHQDHNHLREQNHGNNPSDLEKQTLASYEGHDADIPSNDGYILDRQGELKRQQSIAHQRRVSHASRSSRDNPIIGTDVEKGGANEVSAEESDPNVVYWNGPDDPQNPLNFTSWMKTLIIGLVSAICFVTPLASSMFAPGVPFLMAEFRSDNVELASFVVSIYVLGFAVGPLILAPMSEIYGRLPIYHVCNLGFVAFTVACALATNLNMLIGFRLMAGIFGSAPLTNGMLIRTCRLGLLRQLTCFRGRNHRGFGSARETRESNGGVCNGSHSRPN